MSWGLRYCVVQGSIQRVLCNVEATWYRELLFLGTLVSRVSVKRKERETENKRDIGALFKLLRREEKFLARVEKRKCWFKGKDAWSHFRCSPIVTKLLRFQWSVQKHEMFVR